MTGETIANKWPLPLPRSGRAESTCGRGKPEGRGVERSTAGSLCWTGPLTGLCYSSPPFTAVCLAPSWRNPAGAGRRGAGGRSRKWAGLMCGCWDWCFAVSRASPWPSGRRSGCGRALPLAGTHSLARRKCYGTAGIPSSPTQTPAHLGISAVATERSQCLFAKTVFRTIKQKQKAPILDSKGNLCSFRTGCVVFQECYALF